jgi:hypothetical protein
MWFNLGSNILKNLFNFRKILLVGVGSISFVASISFGIYSWHFKPLGIKNREIETLKKELNECSNRAVEVFTTQNRSVFDAYNEEIKEMESEEIIFDELNDTDFGWMYE